MRKLPFQQRWMPPFPPVRRAKSLNYKAYHCSVLCNLHRIPKLTDSWGILRSMEEGRMESDTITVTPLRPNTFINEKQKRCYAADC